MARRGGARKLVCVLYMYVVGGIMSTQAGGIMPAHPRGDFLQILTYLGLACLGGGGGGDKGGW